MTAVLVRLLAKVVITDDGCWHWAGHLDPEGYGQIKEGGRARQVHRVAYEQFVGPIPDGMTIDHACHDADSCPGGPTCPHRACVRPSHLEPATSVENVARGRGPLHQAAKTHCPQGHAYDEANTYRKPNGARCCRTCRRDSRKMKAA